ncbi:MAG: hypothetical protein HY395_01060 [Candidatus Doudnabacteria bacterium]|nr:hypothetical protein [Candidatus Doudnabacteria bacterium]
MRARFAHRLSVAEQSILISILTGLTLFSFPAGAYAYEGLSGLIAQMENKTPLIFEIKNFPKIPILTQKPEVEAVPIVIEEDPIKIETNPETGKVYMQEPSIKAYVCPKLGDKCKTFIAILKAENGTHECTRDNRGLNRNGSIDVGLAQINWSKSSPYTLDQLRDCKFNLDIALRKYEARGFSPWVAYTTGRYKKHLKYIN